MKGLSNRIDQKQLLMEKLTQGSYLKKIKNLNLGFFTSV